MTVKFAHPFDAVPAQGSLSPVAVSTSGLGNRARMVLVPAVMQLLSFLVDYRKSLDEAFDIEMYELRGDCCEKCRLEEES